MSQTHLLLLQVHLQVPNTIRLMAEFRFFAYISCRFYASPTRFLVVDVCLFFK